MRIARLVERNVEPVHHTNDPGAGPVFLGRLEHGDLRLDLYYDAQQHRCYVCRWGSAPNECSSSRGVVSGSPFAFTARLAAARARSHRAGRSWVPNLYVSVDVDGEEKDVF